MSRFLNKGSDHIEVEHVPVPEATWTFDHALTILRESDEFAPFPALDKFLEANASVLKQPLPFAPSTEVDTSSVTKLQEELTLRSTRYPITEENKKDAIKISELLRLDPLEVLRIISQVSTRVPNGKASTRAKSGELQGFSDDIMDVYEFERIHLYSSAILRERRTVLKLAVLVLQNKSNQSASSYIQQLGKGLATDHKFVSDCIIKLEQLIDETVNQEYLTDYRSELDTLVINEISLHIIDLLKVLINIFISSVINKELVLKWFTLITRTNFLLTVSTASVSNESIVTISALATIACLLIIDLENNYGDLTDEYTYMNDAKILHDITELLMRSPTNPLVIYAWSIVLHRKSLVIEEFSSNPTSQKILSLFHNDIQQMKFLYKAFASKADELDICEAIKECHEILKFDAMYTAILGSFVISMLPYIELTPKIASVIETALSDAPEHIIKKFFSDETSERLIILSRAKLPMSISSYIKICNINGVFAYEEFSVLKSYMESFNEMDLINKYEFDDFNPELVQFNENIDVFPPYEKSGELSLLLEKGIKGKLIPTDNDNEQIVIFLYEYNGLSLIGRVLQNLARQFDVDETASELTVDILKLVTKIIDQCPKAAQEDTISVMSAFVDSENILKVIFDIFDRSLATRSIQFLVPLVNLLTSLLENFSDQVWQYMKKSTLLKNGSKGGSIATILGAIEMVHGNYDFTISIIELCAGLINNCLNISNTTSESLREEILGSLTIHLIQVFESFSHWKYNQLYQKAKIGTLISDIFSRILISAYSIGQNTKLKDKPTRAFAAASENIVASFLITESDEVRSTRSIILMIESVSVAALSYQTNDGAGVWYENWVSSSFELAKLLITTRSILGLPPSQFEKSIFVQSQNLVEIYAQFIPLRKLVIKLLTCLVSAKWPNEPPSLLAHLGNYHANMLIKSMSADLNNTFDDFEMKVFLYDFFAAVMDGNFQEGLSIMFITGRDIRDSLASSSQTTQKAETSILSILKSQISQIYEYPDTAGLHLVEAIALAFNSWTTAKEDSNDKEFIGQLIIKIKTAPVSEVPSEPHDIVSQSYEYKLTSKVAEILALYLFVSKNEACVRDIEALVSDPKFIQLITDNFKIKGYEPLLHQNLHKDFETKWPGYKLLQFVRSTLVKTRRYGVGSVYDISLMDELFKQEDDWDSHRQNIVSASINLRFIESQMAAAKSFGALLTSYCNRSKKPLGPQFLDIVGKLLALNDDVDGPHTAPVFGEIYQERIELAFFLVYKASSSVADDKVLYPILAGCRNILVSNDLDLIAGFADGDTARYRPVMRTLLAALKLVKPNTLLLGQHPELFTELFALIVAKGLRYLFSSIQNEALSSDKRGSALVSKRLSDVLLVLSILKAFVRMDLPAQLRPSLASALVEHAAVKSVLNLYSCSHLVKLQSNAIATTAFTATATTTTSAAPAAPPAMTGTTTSDPVFAELTLSFVYEFVSVPEIADKFLAHGLFAVLVESPVSGIIQRGGIRADTSASYHQLWTCGILPLVLTLLTRYREKLLPESAMFVAYFLRQIETNVNSWYHDSIVVTNATIQETSQIVYLYKVLQHLGIEEYLLETNGNNQTGEIEFIPGLDTAEQRQGLVNVFNYLLSHPKFLSMRVAPVTVEENRLFQNDNKAFVDDLVAEIKELKLSLGE